MQHTYYSYKNDACISDTFFMAPTQHAYINQFNLVQHKRYIQSVVNTIIHNATPTFNSLSLSCSHAIHATKRAMHHKQSIIYGVIHYMHYLILIDSLIYKDNTWYLYVIKTGTKCKNTYIHELLFIHTTLTNIGLSISLHNCYIIYTNTEYTHIQATQKLFTIYKPRNKVLRTHYNIMKKVLSNTHCTLPTAHTHKATLHSITNLYRLSHHTRTYCLDNNITSIHDINRDHFSQTLTPFHHIQITAVQTNTAYCNIPALQSFFNTIQGPFASIDFECFFDVLPDFPNQKPGAHIPFLWASTTFDNIDMNFTNYAFFLHENEYDFTTFIEKLIQTLHNVQTIFVYNDTLEQKILSWLITIQPHYTQELHAIKSRIVDIQKIFTQFWYYHPIQQGKFSLKTISEIIVPSHNYQHIAISNGRYAALSYYFMRKPSSFWTYPSNAELLTQYCIHDAEVLYHILQKLHSFIL